jgi:general stress protein 26
MTGCSDIDHVWDIAESIKTCMLTTVASGRLRSRPMHAVPDRDQGCLWFITDQRGAKDEEIQAAPEVCLAFADTHSNTYLIPLPDQNDFAMYGKDVMDLTIFGLRSI